MKSNKEYYYLRVDNKKEKKFPTIEDAFNAYKKTKKFKSKSYGWHNHGDEISYEVIVKNCG